MFWFQLIRKSDDDDSDVDEDDNGGDDIDAFDATMLVQMPLLVRQLETIVIVCLS